MATSQQDWARRYTQLTRYPRCIPERRARMRAFLANGVHKEDFLTGGDGLISYVHIAILLFVAGAIISLYNINHTVFIVVTLWIGYAAFCYLFFTLLPIFHSDFIICTPLSSTVLSLSLGISYVVIGIFSCTTRCHRLRDEIKRRYDLGFMPEKYIEIRATALKPSPEIDALVLEDIFLSIEGDSALENFIDTIPGFCNSPLVNGGFPPSVHEELQQALYGFLDQTFSFAPVPESVGIHRLISCLNAAHAALPPDITLQILDDILQGRWTEALQSVEIGHSLRRWSLLKNNSIGLKVRRIIACIIACARGRDERWIMLIKDEFGVQDHVLRDYVAHGNSPLLAILIHVIRQSLVGHQRSQPEVLRSLSEFDIIDALPGLQDNFCALWNELVQEARNCVDPSFPIEILREICHLYISLHQGTDSDAIPIDEPAFNLYPFCNIASHSPDLVIMPSTTPSMPGFPSPRLTTHLAHIPSQVTPTTYPSIPVNPGAFLHPNLVANPSIQITTGSDLPSESSPIPYPVHTARYPHPTSESSPPNAPRYIASGVWPPQRPQPSECTEQRDMATQAAAQDPCETSFLANYIYHSIPDNGTTLQRNEGITVVPHVSESTFSPTLMSPSHSNVVPAELPSSGETSLQRIDTSGEPRSSSSPPTTARSHLCLQCTLIVDTDVPTSIGATSAHHVAPDPGSPLSIRAHQPALSTPDIAEHAL